MAAETGKNFTTRGDDGWYTQYYRHSGSTINLYMGFKVVRDSAKKIKITFGLINPNAGTSSYSYNATGTAENYVTVNGTKIVLGSYSYKVGSSWYDTGKTWTIELPKYNTSGNTQIDISYSMAMHNSCFPDSASGIIRIPAGLLTASDYTSLKYYDGTNWRSALVFYYDGSNWQPSQVKYYDGSNWRSVST